eukprot:749614-Hanusia_phi.AAC.1
MRGRREIRRGGGDAGRRKVREEGGQRAGFDYFSGDWRMFLAGRLRSADAIEYGERTRARRRRRKLRRTRGERRRRLRD